MTLATEIFLLFAVFIAGFVDSIAGGGGLISLPAYVFAGLPLRMVAANNKFGNMFGTAYASYTFAKKGKVVWKACITAVPASIIGSALGAKVLLFLPERTLSVCLIFILPIAAAVMLFSGSKTADDSSFMVKGKELLFRAAVIGLLCGLYDGFFGPGTGTFLVLALAAFCRMDYIMASGTAKIINFASNIGGLTVFLLSGNVDINLGIKCAIVSIMGSFFGSSLAIKKGSRVIKPFIILVVAGIVIKLIAGLF